MPEQDKNPMEQAFENKIKGLSPTDKTTSMVAARTFLDPVPCGAGFREVSPAVQAQVMGCISGVNCARP